MLSKALTFSKAKPPQGGPIPSDDKDQQISSFDEVCIHSEKAPAKRSLPYPRSPQIAEQASPEISGSCQGNKKLVRIAVPRKSLLGPAKMGWCFLHAGFSVPHHKNRAVFSK